MPVSRSPTVLRRRLAVELHRLRASAGRTAEDVGKAVGWSKAKVSRYEHADGGGVKPADVAVLLEVYDVRGRHREQLLTLAEEATGKGWWDAYSDALTAGHMEYIGLEAGATSILEWQINGVPGLLQTEQYAREVLSGYHEVATITPRVIQRRVETRLIRQQALARDEPLKLTAVLDESVLRRRRGDRALMYAQLQRLANACELPNVTIRILPLGGSHGLTLDSFAVLQYGSMPDAILPEVVSVEHLHEELYIEGDADTYQFRLAFEHLAEESLSPRESRELILAVASEVWGEA
jgi:transcriptional regulator with XRE-family HTH domain